MSEKLVGSGEDDYIEYLKRYVSCIYITSSSLVQANEREICKAVAKMYGVDSQDAGLIERLRCMDAERG